MADGSTAQGSSPRAKAVAVSPQGVAVPDIPAERGPVPTVRNKPSWAAIGTFLILATASFIYAKAVLVPIIFAFLLALTFSPVRRAMDKLHIPSGITAAVITIGLFVGLIATFAAISAPLTDYVTNAPLLLEIAEERLRGVTETVAQVQQVGEAVESASEDGVQTVRVEEEGFAEKIAGVAPVAMAQIVLTLVLLFFVLASGDMFYEKTVHSIPRFKDKRRAVRIFRDIETKLSRYFFTITIINAGLGVAVGLTMWAMGMPHPYLFGIVAFVMNFIPYLGAIGGIAIATAIGIITFDEVSNAFLVGAAYFALTSLEGQFITPYAVGKSLKLNTVVVFIAVAFWGWLWSVVGMIVAMPILIALRAMSEHIPSLYSFGDFLSARHAEIETAEKQAQEQAEEAQRTAAA